MNLRIGIVQINVTDLHEAKAFYRDSLGLGIREPFGEDGPFELALPGAEKVLVYQVPQAGVDAYGETTGTQLVLYTDALDATVAAWKAKGVEFIRIPWSEDESGIAGCPYGRFIAFKDPAGNVLELLEPHKG